jgi:hypothetical protein
MDQLKAAHPEVRYVQAYRKSGARMKTGAGEQEIWLALTDKGIKFSRDDPRASAETSLQGAGSGPPAHENAGGAVGQPNAAEGSKIASQGLDHGPATDPAIADRQRQEVALKAGSPMQSLHEQLGTMGLGLFDQIDQPKFELDDEARSLIAELDADEKAVKSIKDCL